MNTYKLSNISLKEFRAFLTDAGCINKGVEGGHEKWTKPDSLRPIILQTHIDPIPEFIIRNNLRNIGLRKEDFINWKYGKS